MNAFKSFDDDHAVKFSDCNNLVCPSCGCGEIHHATVTVYDRGEDGQVVNITRVSDTVVTGRSPNTFSGNPSPRRDGIRISMRCEQCVFCPDLLVFQHKGFTIIAWDGE